MRKETIGINVKLDKKRIKRYSIILKLFTDRITDHVDSVDITYSFDIEYFGLVAERLEALLMFINNGAIVEANIKELEHGYSVAKDFFVRFEKMKKALEKI